jgi:hypothetical protein
MYFCFSSSFICSARSRPAPLLLCATSGVAPLEEGAAVDSLERLDVLVPFSVEPGTTRGEFAIVVLMALKRDEDWTVMTFLLGCISKEVLTLVECWRAGKESRDGGSQGCHQQNIARLKSVEVRLDHVS